MTTNMSVPMSITHIAGDRDFRELIELCDRLLTIKGADYTGGAAGDAGRLRNFYSAAERLGLHPRQILSVYLHKHMSAIETFLQKGQVESEPIDGRIADAVNYLALLYKLIKYEERQKKLLRPAPSTTETNT